jgi:hypothetical protein
MTLTFGRILANWFVDCLIKWCGLILPHD